MCNWLVAYFTLISIDPRSRQRAARTQRFRLRGWCPAALECVPGLVSVCAKGWVSDAGVRRRGRVPVSLGQGLFRADIH